MNTVEIKLRKRAQKYLDSVDENTRKKLYRALERLSSLEGDIVKLAGQQNRYRCKIDHYRILFEWRKGEIEIVVLEINTRTNMKY